MSKLILLDKTGHTDLAEWTPEDKASVKVASAKLAELLALGNWAYAVGADGSKEKISAFDKKAEAASEIVVHPQLIGG